MNIIHSFITNIIEVRDPTLWDLQLLFCSSEPPPALALIFACSGRRNRAPRKPACHTVMAAQLSLCSICGIESHHFLCTVCSGEPLKQTSQVGNFALLFPMLFLQYTIRRIYDNMWASDGLGNLADVKLRHALLLWLLQASLVPVLLDMLRPLTANPSHYQLYWALFLSLSRFLSTSLLSLFLSLSPFVASFLSLFLPLLSLSLSLVSRSLPCFFLSREERSRASSRSWSWLVY
jgi:hypothetical protein